VSDPADLTHGVLLRVAEFLKALPADQLAALADGTAKLEVVPKGGRRRPAPTAEPLPVPAEQVRAEMMEIGDRVAARRWLEDQGLKVPQLRALAKALDISVNSKATKVVVLDQIVQWTVGRRLDSEAISRPAPARF
jgi:hypothetical protein